jgi:2-phosphoglycolate phosphatase
MNTIQAILFDLDGTLLDTAPDLVYALNQVRQSYRMSELPLSSIRSIANMGSKAMLKLAFDVDENDAKFPLLRQQFLKTYEEHIADSTQLFPHIEKVLSYAEERNIPWGIVTNKLTIHVTPLLKALRLDKRVSCLVCGDTLSRNKPDPLPLLHAYQLLRKDPTQCVYIGDAASDVIASKAAQTKSLVALYGYINEKDDPFSWKADGYVHEPIEIIEWLEQYPLNLPV